MNWQEEKQQLGRQILDQLYQIRAIKTWYRDKKDGWMLHSGLWSPVYISLREITSKPNAQYLLELIGTSLGKLIKNEIGSVDKILGIAMTGIYIATSITAFLGIPSLYTRKLENVQTLEELEKFIGKYGDHKLVEGDINENDKIVIIDDLVTRFTSKILALEQLKYEAKKRKVNINCKDFVVLLDREQGATDKAKELGYNLYSLIPFKSKLNWLEDKFDPQEYSILKEYFADYSKFQDKDKIKEIISLAKK
jgi:orotate phosphoribosyltransferase